MISLKDEKLKEAKILQDFFNAQNLNIDKLDNDDPMYQDLKEMVNT